MPWFTLSLSAIGRGVRDDGATLDDLREAVTTLEETERTARRVLGGAHPRRCRRITRTREPRSAPARRDDAIQRIFRQTRRAPGNALRPRRVRHSMDDRCSGFVDSSVSSENVTDGCGCTSSAGASMSPAVPGRLSSDARSASRSASDARDSRVCS